MYKVTLSPTFHVFSSPYLSCTCIEQSVKKINFQEFADFEKMHKEPQLSTYDLIRDGGFTDNRKQLFYCIYEEHDEETG